MKQKTRWHDALVLAAVLCAAFLIVTGTQQITGQIGRASCRERV